MSGWGDQPQSRQGDDQYTIEYTPPAPHTPSPAFDFPFHYQSEPDYRTDGSQLQSSWAASQSQARPDDTTSFPAGPSSQASWSSQQPWEGHGDQPATLGGLQPYHHPHRDGLGTAAITTHTHPQSSGPPSLQDQLIYPRPRRLSDLVLPEYISAWRVLEVDAIPATNVAASHATLNSSSSDNNSGSMSAMPSVTDPSHNAFNNVVHHSNIVSFPHRVRAPDSSTRSNRRNTKLTTTKRTASKTSIAPMGLDFIPYGIEGLLEQCNTTMKETAFARSLLPSPEALKEMIDFSWRTVSQNQTDGALQSWAFDKLRGSDKYRITKLGPVIMEILDELKAVVRPFVYNVYNVAFDPNVVLNESHVVSRVANVEQLLTNDEFLYGRLWVDGVHVEAAFASPAILKLASYLLRDGPTQYHRYIKGSDIKPLLAMTATLCRWALQERKTGRYIASFFVPEAHRVHHDHYVSLLESLPPSHLVLLTSLLLNNGSVLSLQ